VRHEICAHRVDLEHPVPAAHDEQIRLAVLQQFDGDVEPRLERRARTSVGVDLGAEHDRHRCARRRRRIGVEMTE